MLVLFVITPTVLRSWRCTPSFRAPGSVKSAVFVLSALLRDTLRFLGVDGSSLCRLQNKAFWFLPAPRVTRTAGMRAAESGLWVCSCSTQTLWRPTCAQVRMKPASNHDSAGRNTHTVGTAQIHMWSCRNPAQCGFSSIGINPQPSFCLQLRPAPTASFSSELVYVLQVLGTTAGRLSCLCGHAKNSRPGVKFSTDNICLPFLFG